MIGLTLVLAGAVGVLYLWLLLWLTNPAGQERFESLLSLDDDDDTDCSG